MKCILIGNYKPDKQESMHRYALMLMNGFNQADVSTEIWYPTVFFGKWAKTTTSGIGKWLGYIDKWIIFGVILKIKSTFSTEKDILYHICDHSNAPYLALLPKSNTVITCHDVLAIQGALGVSESYCPATATGKILQRWIFHYLSNAKKIAAVSQYTLNQLLSLSTTDAQKDKQWVVIPNAFNALFYPMSEGERKTKLTHLGLEDIPFILHVGSSLARKNRLLLLKMLALLGDKWNGKICFAGQSLDQSLLDAAKSLSLENRIVSAIKPDHSTLVALYSACEAFIFPSFSEGFGWPIIEAQACGAPVIASHLDPLPEVSGGAALHANPFQPETFVEAFQLLQDKELKLTLIEDGFQNCKRYETNNIINAYLNLHRSK